MLGTTPFSRLSSSGSFLKFKTFSGLESAVRVWSFLQILKHILKVSSSMVSIEIVQNGMHLLETTLPINTSNVWYQVWDNCEYFRSSNVYNSMFSKSRSSLTYSARGSHTIVFKLLRNRLACSRINFPRELRIPVFLKESWAFNLISALLEIQPYVLSKLLATHKRMCFASKSCSQLVSFEFKLSSWT